MPSADVAIWRADERHIPLIAAHRGLMFAEINPQTTAQQQAEMVRLTQEFLASELTNGAYRHWFLSAPDAHGSVLAGGGLHLRTVLPWSDRLYHARAEPQAIILNVFTEPEHRGWGHARRVMDTIHAHCRVEGIENIVLHASTQGRLLYERMGYFATNEMRIWL